MKKKRYSDISFLPAFLVPSTVIKFLSRWRPVERPQRSNFDCQRFTIIKSAKLFTFSFFFWSAPLVFFFFLHQRCTVVALFPKGNFDFMRLHLKGEKKKQGFYCIITVWDNCMFLFVLFCKEFGYGSHLDELLVIFSVDLFFYFFFPHRLHFVVLQTGIKI